MKIYAADYLLFMAQADGIVALVNEEIRKRLLC